MDYIKTFDNHDEYEEFVAGGEMLYDNVSHCINDNDVHYNPFIEKRIIATFNIASSGNYAIMSTSGVSQNYFSKVEIDGVEQETITSSTTLSPGIHTIKYTLTDDSIIPYGAFGTAYMMESVIIPKTVETIESRAFATSASYQSSRLRSVFIPSSVTQMGSGAFYNCLNLEEVIVEDGNPTYDSREGCNGIIETSTNTILFGSKNTIIKPSVSAIADEAFLGVNVGNITIPNTIISMGTNAFYNSIISTITIDNQTLLNSGTSVQSWLKPSNKCQVIIGDSVTSIGTSGFSSCNKISSITLSNSVTTCGGYCFSSCDALSSVNFSNTSLISLGERAFSTCQSLSSITLPNTLTTIGTYGFYNCSGLTSIVIPDNVTEITANLLYNCKNLSAVTIGSSVTRIRSYAFNYCSNLTTINIPDNVKTLDTSAIEYCGVKTLTIGSGTTSISESNLLRGCNLSSITIDNANTVYDSRNNCNAIIKKSGNKLLRGCYTTVIPSNVVSIGTSAFTQCTGLTEIIIPDSVTSIGASAFTSCNNATGITIGNGVKTIGTSAFYGCKNATSLTIGSAVTAMSASCFTNCSGLTTVTVPNSVTKMGNYVFSGCKNLISATIGSSVTTIGTYLFQNCSGLTSITSLATTAPSISANTFSAVKTGGTLYTPSGSSGYDTWMQNANYYLGSYNWTQATIT